MTLSPGGISHKSENWYKAYWRHMEKQKFGKMLTPVIMWQLHRDWVATQSQVFDRVTISSTEQENRHAQLWMVPPSICLCLTVICFQKQEHIRVMGLLEAQLTSPRGHFPSDQVVSRFDYILGSYILGVAVWTIFLKCILRKHKETKHSLQNDSTSLPHKKKYHAKYSLKSLIWGQTPMFWANLGGDLIIRVSRTHWG